MPPISVNNAASAFGKSHTLNFFLILAQTKQVSLPFIHEKRLFKVSRFHIHKIFDRSSVSFADFLVRNQSLGHMAHIT